MPPVSPLMHAHARTHARTCMHARTLCVHTFGAKHCHVGCSVLGHSTRGLAMDGLICACVHIVFLYSQGRSTGGQGPWDKTDPGQTANEC